MAPANQAPAALEVEWSHLVGAAEWGVYHGVLEAISGLGRPYAVGGGFAFSAHARRWRDTKDLDIYVLPEDLGLFRAAVTELGFEDYYEQRPYDRQWIYRGWRDGYLVDLIWAMANHHAQVDREWLTRAAPVLIRGVPVPLLPAEELIWAKLFVIQRDRCDWPDLLNVLYSCAESINWPHLLGRVTDHAPLLGGLLSVFSWLCPAQARRIPEWVWPRVGLLAPLPTVGALEPAERVRLLDARDWFGPLPGNGGRQR